MRLDPDRLTGPEIARYHCGLWLDGHAPTAKELRDLRDFKRGVRLAAARLTLERKP